MVYSKLSTLYSVIYSLQHAFQSILFSETV